MRIKQEQNKMESTTTTFLFMFQRWMVYVNCVHVHNLRTQFYDFQPLNEPDEWLVG